MHPKEQSALAKRLGEEIPRNLLPPEELAEQLGVMIRGYMQNPALMADIRQKAAVFTRRYRSDIAAFILPHMESVVSTAMC